MLNDDVVNDVMRFMEQHNYYKSDRKKYPKLYKPELIHYISANSIRQPNYLSLIFIASPTNRKEHHASSLS